MPRGKKLVPANAVVTLPTKSTPVISVMKDGAVVREYNVTDHGKDYKDLAIAFAEKIGGSIK